MTEQLTKVAQNGLSDLADWHWGKATTLRKVASTTAIDKPEPIRSSLLRMADWHDEQKSLIRTASQAQAVEGGTLEENVRVLLDNTPREFLVRDRQGGGPEDLRGSLSITWSKLLKAATAKTTVASSSGSLLRQPVKSIAEVSKTIPGGCYCQPGTCQAPVVMGSQTPCLRTDTTKGDEQLRRALQTAIWRLEDMLKGDDGQAWKEAEKALPALKAHLLAPGVDAQPVLADPCPGCKRGGVCRTPKCGRLNLPTDHPYRSATAEQKP